MSKLSWSLRALGALALFAIAADHLYEYYVDGYSSIPTIGTLFLLNGIGGIALGLALLVAKNRPAGVAAVAGIGLATASLIALFVSESTPLFGFMEFGYRTVIVVAIVAEVSAIVLLGAFLAGSSAWRSRASLPQSS